MSCKYKSRRQLTHAGVHSCRVKGLNIGHHISKLLADSELGQDKSSSGRHKVHEWVQILVDLADIVDYRVLLEANRGFHSLFVDY